jgi:hypothetical protein
MIGVHRYFLGIKTDNGDWLLNHPVPGMAPVVYLPLLFS